MSDDQAAERVRRRVLALLLAAYVLNFVDRQILGVLAVPIKAELDLSDRQLGLMGGVAFALFYSTLAVPVAVLADRRGAAKVVAGAIALWSLFTALCGLAAGFWHLFVARMAVGIGEAGGVSPAHALIAGHFPPARRARALAVFSFGIPLGSALGILLGGWIAARFDWRVAFLALGLAGLPLAFAVWRWVPEPPRTVAGPAVALSGVRTLLRKPVFWLLSLGAASGSIVGYGLLFWLPSLFVRSFGLSLAGMSLFYGSIVLVGGLAGIWLGGWLGDRFGPRRPAAYAVIPAVCLALSVPFYAAALFAPSLPLAWLLFVVPQMLGLAWLGPVMTAVQGLVPQGLRATASASFLLVNNLIGLGLGVSAYGELSTRMVAAHGTESLRWAILYGLGFYLVAAVLYALAATRLSRNGALHNEFES